MARWVWFTACACSTAYLVVNGAEGWLIALNVMLDVEALVSAVRGGR